MILRRKPVSTTKQPRTATATSPSSEMLSSLIREEAYSVYCSRGTRPGNAVSDWLEAERKIKKRHKLS